MLPTAMNLFFKAIKEQDIEMHIQGQGPPGQYSENFVNNKWGVQT